ncbi:MAG: ABC transporter ATP-binding protein [Candidatus Thermoplasmatota archaeon]|nr:ABC transporter ATP-binding protein [Candidatus Thermoplasmatota archaeon]
MPRIELKGITKRFGEIVAVKDVNLTIEDKEYVTLLGPSGCGKTTLVKIISGIWEPTEGEVLIDGKRMNEVPVEDRDLGYVFQNIALFPHMTVLSNATYAPIVKDFPVEERDKIAQEVLDLVDLLDRKKFFPGELSTGTQQKAGLARALASQAKLLILDEPLSALDARVRVDLRYELRRLVKDLGLTAVHVTHDQEEASSVSDRIVVMRAGRIVEIDSPENLYNNPKSIFTANFVGEMNFLQGAINKLRDYWAIIELRNQEYLTLSNREFRMGAAIILAMRPENLRVEELRGTRLGNAIPGRIKSIRFMGSYLRYEVLLASDDHVFVDSFAGEEFKEGEEVAVSFDETNILTFPAPREGLSEVIKLE